MRFLKALALICGLVAPAAASQYFNTPISSPTAGTAWQSLSGTFYIAPSSSNVSSVTANAQTQSTWTIVLDGTKGISARNVDTIFMNVMSFGAKCDGVTHDDAAFAAAIQAAYVQNGGTIIVPNGVGVGPCILSGNPGMSIQHPHIHFKSSASGSTLSSPSQIEYVGTSTGIVVGGTGNAADFVMEDIDLWGTSAAHGSGIVFTSSADASMGGYQGVLERVSVHAFTYPGTAGIWIDGGIMDTFRNVASYANYWGFYLAGGNATTTHFDGISARVNLSYGLYVNQNTGFIVDGMSLFESNADAGVAMLGAAATANYSMFFDGIWLENNVTGYLTGVSTSAYQFQFLTNPASPNQGLLRNVEIKNVVTGMSVGKGDLDIANADSVKVENFLSAASASSDSVKVELTATNVSLYNIYNANNGKIDSLQQAAWYQSSGTVRMWGNIVSSGNITMGTTLLLANNSIANSIRAQGSTGRLILDGDGAQAGAEITLNGSSQGASAGKAVIAGSSITLTALNGTARLTIDGSGNVTVPIGLTAGVFIGPGTSLTGTAASLTAGNVTTNANMTGDVTSVGNATTAAATQANITTLSNAGGISVTGGGNLNVTYGVKSATHNVTSSMLVGATGIACSTCALQVVGGTSLGHLTASNYQVAYTSAGVCSAATCTMNANTPGISAIVRTSPGDYQVQFAAGTFSTAPACAVTSNQIANFIDVCIGNGLASTSIFSVSCAKLGSTASAQDESISVICIGP